jgi:uncharacterized protein
MDLPSHASNRRWILWALLGIFSLALLVASIWFTDSPPPSKIVMATGAARGAYDLFGQKYSQRLKTMGLTVNLHNTHGSIENLKLLIEGKADVAFVQGGTYQLVQDEDKSHALRAIASVYLEPLWVFSNGDKVRDTFAELKGKRISVGLTDSGTEAISRLLLRAHDIDEKNSKFFSLSAGDAAEALKEGKIDAAMIVGSYQEPAIMDLLRTKGVKLMSFKREIAYSRTFPYLTPVKVAAGLLDLRDDIPPTDVVLLAPAAMLVCRDELHPTVVEQVLKVAQAVHQQGSLLDGPKAFPTLDGVDIPVHEAAETYMKSGESFVSRVLPYWAVRITMQLKIFVLPLLIVWIPALKLVPAIYKMRITMLLKQHYASLREAETNLVHANTAAELRQRLQELENLRKNMEQTSRKVPGHLQNEVYHWRVHTSLVRDEALERLQRLEERAPHVHSSLFTPESGSATQAGR